MTTPDPTPDTKLEVQELTDDNLEEVSGGGRLGDRQWAGNLTNPEIGLDVPLARPLIE
jgi:hypothetical protein